jgi:hypothetical protein
MTFLAPWAGVIGALVATPVLVALYLLKLRRKPLRVSSTLLWEQAVQDLQANVPLRWLRTSLMLVLQLLALAALLVALARPALVDPSGAGERTLIIIDRSASMSAKNADGTTRLEQAKSDALERIDALARGSGRDGRAEAMVLALGAETRALTGFTSSTRELREAVASITATDQPGRLAPALAIVESMSIGLTGENADERAPTVLLFSDGSFADADGGLGPVRLVSAVRSGQPGEGSATGAGGDNLGIVAASARRDYENPALVRAFVRVLNAGPGAVETAVRGTLDGRSIGSAAITVPAAGAGSPPGGGGPPVPGEAAVTLEFESPGAGVLTLSLPREDALASDNAASMVLRSVARARVLVVAPAGAGGRVAVDPFLLSALTVMDLGEVRVIDAAQYEGGVAQARVESREGEVWPGFDLVVFDRVRPGRTPRQATLSFGAGLPIDGLTVAPGDAGSGRAGASTTRIVSWRRTHAVLRYAALDAVVVNPAMRMTLPEMEEGGGGGEAAASRIKVTELALGQDGPLIAALEEPGTRGVRRIVVAFELLRSNWGPDVSFPVFLSSAVEYLTGKGDAAAGRATTTGEPLVVDADAGAERVVLRGPVELAAERTAEAARSGEAVSLGIPERAGVYRVEGGSAPGGGADVAVNLVDATESALASRVQASGAAGAGSGAGGQGGVGGGGESRREIWHWFVLIAGVLLAAEWFLFAWKMRA